MAVAAPASHVHCHWSPRRAADCRAIHTAQADELNECNDDEDERIELVLPGDEDQAIALALVSNSRNCSSRRRRNATDTRYVGRCRVG